MQTDSVICRPFQRFLSGENAEHRKYLYQQLRLHIRALGLTKYKSNKLFKLLVTRPPCVREREFSILLHERAVDPLGPRLSLDDLASLYTASRWNHDQLKHDQLLPSAIKAKWSSLSRQEKAAARRIGKRFQAQTVAFRSGKEPYHYSYLVIKLALDIEQVTERKLAFGRNSADYYYREGKVGEPDGPMMRVMMAALEVQLFASGPPSRETVSQIIKRTRQLRRLNNRNIELLLANPIASRHTLENALRSASPRPLRKQH
jgi:hypothetical protein